MANDNFQPLSGNSSPRFADSYSFMRLPLVAPSAQLDVAVVGVPLDIATSNRPGARLAPAEIRQESRLIRPVNLATSQAPFDRRVIADCGDIAINTYSILDSYQRIETYIDCLQALEIIPVSLGGDHSISLPILRSVAKHYGPVALIHVDAHSDSNDTMFAERFTHGTVFRRAYEEQLLIGTKTYQIGLRGSGYGAGDLAWPKSVGFQLHLSHDYWHRSLTPLMDAIRFGVGDTPVYLSFDIDALDPAFAPGTGTPEIGGLTSIQALEIIRGCQGLNVVGCDLVEVCPPFDLSRATSLLAANLVFEMLCVIP